MKKTLIALAAAGALAVGTVSVPQQAEAHVWWWIPAAIVGGVVVGGAIAHSQARAQGYYGAYGAPYYGPRGSVYVSPTNCRIVQQRVRGGYREVEVCR